MLERASARETAARVALGTVAKSFLRQALGVEVLSHVVSLGQVDAPVDVLPGPDDLERIAGLKFATTHFDPFHEGARFTGITKTHQGVQRELGRHCAVRVGRKLGNQHR